MNIRNRRAIHETAANALRRATDARRIILIYGGICCGLSLLATVISALLGTRISGATGLGNIGLRSVLSTGQSVLPLVNILITSCLSLGYHISILSFTRGYDASPRTLKSGFRYFGSVLRTLMFQLLVYFLLGIGALYASSYIFMATPYSEPFIEAMDPYIASASLNGLAIDGPLAAAAMDTLIPMLWIYLAVLMVLILPVYYRFRMVDFCLADDPQNGALYALTKSRFLMRRNCFALFRLDLSLWWFYAAQVLISLVCYGDLLLPMLGVTFPWSDTVSYYLFYGLSLLIQLALYWFGMNRATAVYAVAYDALLENMPQPNLPAQM